VRSRDVAESQKICRRTNGVVIVRQRRPILKPLVIEWFAPTSKRVERRSRARGIGATGRLSHEEQRPDGRFHKPSASIPTSTHGIAARANRGIRGKHGGFKLPPARDASSLAQICPRIAAVQRVVERCPPDLRTRPATQPSDGGAIKT